MTELPLAANIDRNWARERIIGLDEQVTYYRQMCEQQALTIDKFQKRVAELETHNDALHARIEELGFRCQILETSLVGREKRIAELEAAINLAADALHEAL